MAELAEAAAWRLNLPPEIESGERQELLVYALHPSVKRYLGPPPDYSGQDLPEWKPVLAEVVTEAIVRRIVSKKYPPIATQSTLTASTTTTSPTPRGCCRLCNAGYPR